MVNFCCVRGCGKEAYPGSGISFFRFPKDEVLKEKWLKIVPGKITKSSVVCGQHFLDHDFYPFSISKNRINPDAVPSIFPMKVDGVTHVTELSEVPENNDSMDDSELVGEESEIAQAGADEGHEEWLSEGILTDDDYNAASQEEDRTDSQVSSHDEEHPNNSTEQLDTTAESEVQEAIESNNIEDDANTAENDDNTENEVNATENDVNTTENDVNTTENDVNTTENDLNTTENDVNTIESETNMPESKDNLIEMEANIDYAANIDSQTYTESEAMEVEENIADNDANNADTDANIANDDEDIADTDANIAEENANANSTAYIIETTNSKLDDTVTEANISESIANITEDNANITEDNANITEDNANITEDNPDITESKADQKSTNVKGQKQVRTADQNIEETMKHLDGAKEDLKNDIFDSLLLMKADTKVEQSQKQQKAPEQNDGNDTDDLLRMLGEDDNKSKKKLTKTVKDIRAALTKERKETASSDDDDDDDFVFEGATLKKLQAAKNALAKKQPAIKAEPEDMEDGDDENEISGDEKKTMKKMFNMKSKPTAPRKTAPPRSSRPARYTPNVMTKRPPKDFLTLTGRPNILAKTQSPTVKQYQNKRMPAKSILKPSAPSPRSVTVAKATKTTELKTQLATKLSFEPPEVKTPALFKSSSILKPIDKKAGEQMMKDNEMMGDEEFADGDEFNMDEDEFMSDGELSRSRQKIMRPEMMDEEVPSDGESHSEDGSLYDELPSSGSEDLDDWFQLDIRAEKAGDYLPLLGSRAKELLLEEKRRVTSRLQTLKQSLSALTDSGKKQAEQLRDATMALAELDDMLKAS